MDTFLGPATYLLNLSAVSWRAGNGSEMQQDVGAFQSDPPPPNLGLLKQVGSLDDCIRARHGGPG